MLIKTTPFLIIIAYKRKSFKEKKALRLLKK